MPAFLKDLGQMEFDLSVYGQDPVRAYDPRRYPCMGVSLMEFMLDARNVAVVGPTGAAIEVIPFIQYASTRTDRPGTLSPSSSMPRPPSGAPGASSTPPSATSSSSRSSSARAT